MSVHVSYLYTRSHTKRVKLNLFLIKFCHKKGYKNEEHRFVGINFLDGELTSNAKSKVYWNLNPA